jgi:glycosyltransferase involved in cell wall biosynthesis
VPATEQEPIRVCFVASHAQLGGAEGVLASLMATLGPQWIADVLVLGDGPFVSRLREMGTPARVVRCGRRAGLVAGALRMRRILVKDSPQLVHANGVKAAMVAAMAATGTGIPVVWHKHDSARDGWLGRWIARRCALVVGVSDASLTSLIGVRGVRTTVVRNGIPEYAIDRDAARQSLRRMLGTASDSRLIGMVGRLHPGKGQLTLVEICDELRDRLPRLELVLAGAPDQFEPGYEELLAAKVKELGLEGRVSFLGYRDDVVEIIAGCDLLAMPSMRDPTSGWREGFPLAPLESMAVGTPVIGYAEPGIAEVVGSCGELVATGDRAALREAIARLIEDEGERERLGKCGLARVRRFGIGEATSRMEETYRMVVQDRPPAAEQPVPAGA